jgi:hypothetical protein
MATGAAVIDFGAAPGRNDASVTVTGQTGIVAASEIEPWMMAESTADHNVTEHIMAPIKLTAGNIVDNTSFTIYAASEWRLTGTFAVHWVWK